MLQMKKKVADVGLDEDSFDEGGRKLHSVEELLEGIKKNQVITANISDENKRGATLEEILDMIEMATEGRALQH